MVLANSFTMSTNLTRAAQSVYIHSMKQTRSKVASRTPQEQQAPKPTNPVGRPTLYKPEYCQMLVEHMKQGKSFYTFGIVCDPPVCWDTLKEWANVHPDFSAAKKLGRQYEMSWWDNLHRMCSATGEGNMTGIVWAQKNKFPAQYKERAPKGQQQIQLNASMDVKQLVANMQPEQIAQLVAAIEAKTIQLEAAKEGEDVANTKG